MINYTSIAFLRKSILDPLPDAADYVPLPEEAGGFNQGLGPRPDQEPDQDDQ